MYHNAIYHTACTTINFIPTHNCKSMCAQVIRAIEPHCWLKEITKEKLNYRYRAAYDQRVPFYVYT